MSIDNRDWHRAWWRKKLDDENRPDPRYFPKQFRGSGARHKRVMDSSYADDYPQRPKSWHPVLIVMFWTAVLLVLYVIFKKTGG